MRAGAGAVLDTEGPGDVEIGRLRHVDAHETPLTPSGQHTAVNGDDEPERRVHGATMSAGHPGVNGVFRASWTTRTN